MLYLVYAESLHYCDYGQHWVVEASNELGAEDLANECIEEYFYEQDSDQLVEEGYDLDGMVYAQIVSVEEFGPKHECWKYYQDPKQAQFYIELNL